jgi:CheY-like chemotaxis protein
LGGDGGLAYKRGFCYTGVEETLMSPKRILIIDDEADIREVAQVSLEMVGGYQVIQAPSGEEGARLAKLERPDAILLDVMMPELDGPATFRLLRQSAESADIPVVLLTAKVLQPGHDPFAGLGVAGVIAKPFDPMTLAAQLARTLGWGA